MGLLKPLAQWMFPSLYMSTAGVDFKKFSMRLMSLTEGVLPKQVGIKWLGLIAISIHTPPFSEAQC